MMTLKHDPAISGRATWIVFNAISVILTHVLVSDTMHVWKCWTNPSFPSEYFTPHLGEYVSVLSALEKLNVAILKAMDKTKEVGDDGFHLRAVFNCALLEIQHDTWGLLAFFDSFQNIFKHPSCLWAFRQVFFVCASAVNLKPSRRSLRSLCCGGETEAKKAAQHDCLCCGICSASAHWQYILIHELTEPYKKSRAFWKGPPLTLTRQLMSACWCEKHGSC